MTAVLFLHISCAFAWLGCVLAETARERGANPKAFARWLSRMSWRIDLAVELPAFLGILLTGGLMAGHFPMTSMQALKIASGLIAVGANVHCALHVPQTAPAAQDANARRWGTVDPSQQRFGAVAMILLALGAHLLVG